MLLHPKEERQESAGSLLRVCELPDTDLESYKLTVSTPPIRYLDELWLNLFYRV